MVDFYGKWQVVFISVLPWIVWTFPRRAHSGTGFISYKSHVPHCSNVSGTFLWYAHFEEEEKKRKATQEKERERESTRVRDQSGLQSNL